jgi:hypothetical protein
MVEELILVPFLLNICNDVEFPLSNPLNGQLFGWFENNPTIHKLGIDNQNQSQ